MILNVTNKALNLFKKFNLINAVHLLWCLTLVISAIKNLTLWNFSKFEDPNYFISPVFDSFEFAARNFTIEILWINFFLLFLLFSKKRNFQSIPFIVHGLTNFFLQSSDYLNIHHDMLLSSLLFPAYGFYLISKDNWRIAANQIILAITVSTYLIAGIVKINSDFLSGEIVEVLLERADYRFYWPLFELLTQYSSFLAWYALIVELIEPLVLLFFTGIFKLYLMLLVFPFHIGILLTGTGTVYNLIYPAVFMHIVFNSEKEYLKNGLISYIYRLVFLAFISFSLIYDLLMIRTFIRSIL